MDTKRLETIRFTALDHVQRYNLACPSSTTCRSRHERSLLRLREPCTREVLRDRRFVLEVTRCSEGAAATYAFDLLKAAIDAALLELLIDPCKKRLAGSRAFVQEANKAIGPGPQNGRPRQSVAKNRSKSDGHRSMRLTERKRILIDIHRALYLGAISASPPDYLSLIQTLLEIAKEDIYDIARYDVCGTDAKFPLPPCRGVVFNEAGWERARVRVRCRQRLLCGAGILPAVCAAWKAAPQLDTHVHPV